MPLVWPRYPSSRYLSPQGERLAPPHNKALLLGCVFGQRSSLEHACGYTPKVCEHLCLSCPLPFLGGEGFS